MILFLILVQRGVAVLGHVLCWWAAGERVCTSTDLKIPGNPKLKKFLVRIAQIADVSGLIAVVSQW